MRYGVHKIWPQSTALTLTFDLQNLIRQSIGDSDYFPYVSSRLLEWFMRYCGNCTTGMNEHSNETAWKRNAFADSVPKTWTSTSVRTDLYPHMKILLRAIYCNGVCGPHAGWFRTSGQQISQKMGDSLHWTPMSCRAKLDAVSSIIGRKIRNRTNKQTNSKWYIHTLPIGMCGYKSTHKLFAQLRSATATQYQPTQTTYITCLVEVTRVTLFEAVWTINFSQFFH